ncbi:hypothetical protein GJ496_011915 [Pomphorhynchus laevis]|nr:hypothetical protein GJ496_011913 [Pomphorhynchus laevis]KAI0984563.1 hypothetical protein GJ496_011915 [Pomphorhynchus laevis]
MYLCRVIDSELEKDKTVLEKCIESQKIEISSMTDVITATTKSLSLSSERLPLLFSSIPKIVESLNNQYKFNEKLSARLSDSTNEILESLKVKSMKDHFFKVSNDKKFELSSDKYTTYSHSITEFSTSHMLLNMIGFER